MPHLQFNLLLGTYSVILWLARLSGPKDFPSGPLFYKFIKRGISILYLATIRLRDLTSLTGLGFAFCATIFFLNCLSACICPIHLTPLFPENPSSNSPKHPVSNHMIH